MRVIAFQGMLVLGRGDEGADTRCAYSAPLPAVAASYIGLCIILTTVSGCIPIPFYRWSDKLSNLLMVSQTAYLWVDRPESLGSCPLLAIPRQRWEPPAASARILCPVHHRGKTQMIKMKSAWVTRCTANTSFTAWGIFSVLLDIRVVSSCIEDALEIQDRNFWMESVGNSLAWHHINHDRSSNLGLFSVTGLKVPEIPLSIPARYFLHRMV